MDEEFAEWLTHGLEEDYDYHRKTRELAKDSRYTKPQMVDVNNSYREFQDYTNSTLYNYVKKAEDLLPETFDISPEQLRKAMTTSYNLDNKTANDVVHEIMSNDKNVEVSQNSYTKDIRIRRKTL